MEERGRNFVYLGLACKIKHKQYQAVMTLNMLGVTLKTCQEQHYSTVQI